MLESLDREYKRDEDWCNSEKAGTANIQAKAAYLVQLINKHNEQKEAFLKVSTKGWGWYSLLQGQTGGWYWLCYH